VCVRMDGRAAVWQIIRAMLLILPGPLAGAPCLHKKSKWISRTNVRKSHVRNPTMLQATGVITPTWESARRSISEQALVALLLGTGLGMGGFLRVYLVDGGWQCNSLILIILRTHLRGVQCKRQGVAQPKGGTGYVVARSRPRGTPQHPTHQVFACLCRRPHQLVCHQPLALRDRDGVSCPGLRPPLHPLQGNDEGLLCQVRLNKHLSSWFPYAPKLAPAFCAVHPVGCWSACKRAPNCPSFSLTPTAAAWSGPCQRRDINPGPHGLPGGGHHVRHVQLHPEHICERAGARAGCGGVGSVGQSRIDSTRHPLYYHTHLDLDTHNSFWYLSIHFLMSGHWQLVMIFPHSE